MTKKEKNVNATIRMPESFLVEIDNIAEETKQERSTVLRLAVKRFLNLSKKVREGKILTILPKLDSIRDYQKVLNELEEVSESSSEETKLILSEVIDSLEFKILDELKKKHPDHKGFFNIKSDN